MAIDPAVIAEINEGVRDTKTDIYFTFLDPDTIWTASINEPGGGILARTVFSFDAGTGAGTDLSSFAFIEAVQEVWFGIAFGDRTYGRGRIRAISSGDAGVSGTLTIAANSLVVPNDAVITFILYYPLKPKPPFIDQQGVFYKDKDIQYTDQNKFAPPIVIAGGNRAQFLEGGSWVLTSQLPSSYSYTPGATITDYTATVLPAAGSVVSITAGTGVGTITFTTPGHRWVRYQVTDSNGKTSRSWRWYYAHDPSPSSSNEHYPFRQFSVTSSRWSQNGWEAGISATDGVSFTEMPDETIGILWFNNYFKGSLFNFSLAPDKNTSLLSGYIRKDTNPTSLDTGSKKADIQLTTIGRVDAQEYSYSMSLHQVEGDPAKWWEFSSWMTPTRASASFMQWHSTLTEVADVLGVEDNTDPIAWAEFEDGTLYNMPNKFLQDRSIRHIMLTDMTGRIHITPDIQLSTDAERATYPIQHHILKKDLSGDTTLLRTPEPQSPFAHVSGLSYPGTFSPVTGEPNADPHCSIAPGTDPLDKGPSPATLTRQTLTSQTHANELSGRVLAERNNVNREYRVKFAGFWAPLLDPAYAQFWRTDILVSDTVREVVLTNLKLIFSEVSLRIDVTSGIVLSTVTFEPEALGRDGIEVECPSFPNLGGFAPFFPEDNTAGQGDLLTASSVYRLDKVAKNWTELTSESTLDMFADPAWDGVDPGETPIWRCGVGYIKYSPDSGDTWVTRTPPNPPNDQGDAPAPTAGVVTYFQGAPGVEDQFAFAVRWQNDVNEWRGWLVDTADAGITWEWTSLIPAPVGGGLGSEVVADSNLTAVGKGSTNFADVCAQISDTEMLFIGTDAFQVLDIYYTVQNGVQLDHTGTNVASNVASNAFSVTMFDDERFIIIYQNDSTKDLWTVTGTVIAGIVALNAAANTVPAASFGGGTVSIRAKEVAGDRIVVALGTGLTAYAFGIFVSGTTLGNVGTPLLIHTGLTNVRGYDITQAGTSDTVFASVGIDDASIGTGNGEISRLTMAASGNMTITNTTSISLGGSLTSCHRGTITSDDDDCTAIIGHISDNELYIAHVQVQIGLNASTFVNLNIGFGSFLASGPLTSDNIALTVRQLSPSAQSKAYTIQRTAFNTYSIFADILLLNTGTNGITVGTRRFPQYFAYDATLEYLIGAAVANELYLISVALDVGADLMYATYSVGDVIVFTVFDLLESPHPILDTHELGPGTIVDVQNRVSVAFVRGLNGVAGGCWIHGRYKHPFDLMLDQYLLEYDFEEFDFNTYTVDFGLHYLGAMIDDWNVAFLIENDTGGPNARLWILNFESGVADFRGTLPFNGNVRYNGIAYDWLGDFFYAAGDDPGTDPPIVIQTTGPYTIYLAIQYNHPVSPGIKALEVLI